MKITIPYHPRPYQAKLHAEMEAHRFCVIVMHRRAGKTVMVLNHMLKQALLQQKPNAMYAYIAPYRNQAKSVSWDYLKHFSAPIPGRKVNESELSIALPNNAIIRVFGADNADALRGLRFDGVVLDEVADMQPDVWQEVVRPALADRKGWAVFIGTPKGVNLFSELYQQGLRDPGWFSALLRVDETGALSDDEIEALKGEMSEKAYRQEFLCDFAASSDDVLITIDLVTEACQRTVRPEDVEGMPLIMGVDVARFGSDASAVCLRRGLICQPIQVFHNLDNMDLADRINDLVHEHQPDAVFVDSGQGQGVIDRLRHIGVDCVEVPFGGKARQPRFNNRRSEMWYGVREWLRAGGFIPDDATLKAELTTPTYAFDTTGRICLERKEDIKERLGKSPDQGDALALTFAAPVASARDALIAARTQQAKQYDPLAW
jgi:hypothetical protein